MLVGGEVVQLLLCLAGSPLVLQSVLRNLNRQSVEGAIPNITRRLSWMFPCIDVIFGQAPRLLGIVNASLLVPHVNRKLRSVLRLLWVISSLSRIFKLENYGKNTHFGWSIIIPPLRCSNPPSSLIASFSVLYPKSIDRPNCRRCHREAGSKQPGPSWTAQWAASKRERRCGRGSFLTRWIYSKGKKCSPHCEWKINMFDIEEPWDIIVHVQNTQKITLRLLAEMTPTTLKTLNTLK